MRPTLARIRRPRQAAFGLAAALLPLMLLVTLAGAQAPPDPRAAARPAQISATIYLPLVRGPGAPAPAGSPVIESFQLSAPAGPMAAEVELRWRASGATSLRIEPDVGDVRGAASASVYPIATTTYTLTATNAKGSTSATVTYRVNAPPVPNPLTVAARPDPARAIGASLGAAGGSVEATGADGTRYTLVVPPEALLYTEVITLTPVAAVDGMPFAAAAVRAVSIAPEGLLFIEPATLLITPPATPAAPRTLGLAFRGAGTEFHLRTVQGPDGGALAQAAGASSLSVVAARSYGAAEVGGDSDLLAPLLRNSPSDPADRAEHVYNAALDEAQNATVRRAELLTHLRDDYLLFTGTQLTAASNDPEGPAPFDLESAVRSYISWRARVRAATFEEQLRPEISQANLLLGEALRKAGELATERCNAQRPAQGFALQRYMGYAKRFGLVNTRAALEERLEKCWRFQLTFDSDLKERGDGGAFAYDLHVRAVVALSYEPEQSRMVGSAPLTWVRFAWLGEQGGCTFITRGDSSTFDAASGTRGLSLAPVSRTSPEVRLRFAYDPGLPRENVIIDCPEIPSTTAQTTAWRTYFDQLHADELKDGSFVATRQANISGEDPGWVYNGQTSGPSGQTATESTTITLQHTPAR